MRNKKGFTLIELLAVIVILSIISLIATPIVVDIIKDARESSFKQSIKTLYKAAHLKLSKQRNPEFPFYVEYVDGKATTKETLDGYYKGQIPKHVQIKILKDGTGTIAVYDETLKRCAYKDYNSEEVKSVKLSVKEKCIIDTEIKGDEAPIFTGYSCSNPGNVKITEEKYFTFDQSTGTITGYNAEGGTELVIPCNIAGTEVKAIGSSAFYNKGLTSVIMPDTIKTIGNSAFRSNNISTLELGNSLETIGYYAFTQNQIKEVVFPDSLKKITGDTGYSSHGAFYNNPLEKVVFGSGIEEIGYGSFYSIPTLVEVDFSKSTNLKTIGSSTFSGGSFPKIEIPASVTTIGTSAFASNKNLTEILVKGKKDSSGFTSLGSSWNGTCTNIIYEFSSCYIYSGNTITDYLSSCSKNIEIPSSLDGVTITTIADNAFKDKGLTRVVVPSTITSIGDNAFSGNIITPLVIMGKGSAGDFTNVGSNWISDSHIIYENSPSGCFKITDNAVTGYYSSESVCPKVVTVPTGVTKINDSALANTGITSLTIPNTVTVIGKNILTNNVMDNITVQDGTRFTSLGTSWNGTAHKVNFQGDSYEYNCFTVSNGAITKYPSYCSATVDLSSGVIQGQTITSIGNSAFKGSGVNNIKLGNSITSIGTSAFENNNILTLDFGNSVTSVGAKAFYNTGLVDILIPRSVTSIGDNAFASNPNLASITIMGKTNLSGFTSLGTSWNGTCTNIVYSN